MTYTQQTNIECVLHQKVHYICLIFKNIHMLYISLSMCNTANLNINLKLCCCIITYKLTVLVMISTLKLLKNTN